jgi:glycosyltransferase involved in cell wall biosynthesis
MVVRVSAICSVRNGQDFIRGRLADLMDQTLYKAGELEIMVINSASTDTTGTILEREYLPHITLIQTPFRESMYAAWNRAIRLAKGHYIVPANVDDRLRPDACAVMADYLDAHPDTHMVCPDSFVTATANATWEGDYACSREPPYTTGRLDFVNSVHPQTTHCKIGNTPMWMRALHAQIGYLDQSYLIAGDYEWALRLEAHGKRIDWIPDVLGLFYFHSSTQGQTYGDQSAYESRRAVLRWRSAIEKRAALPVIPTSWVQAAQTQWKQHFPPDPPVK